MVQRSELLEELKDMVSDAEEAVLSAAYKSTDPAVATAWGNLNGMRSMLASVMEILKEDEDGKDSNEDDR